MVFCFEPLKRKIESSKNALDNPVAVENLQLKAVLLQFAVAKFDGLQKMYVTLDPGQSSSYAQKGANRKPRRHPSYKAVCIAVAN